MTSNTSIEWTATYNADGTVTQGKSWNPVTGCDEVSPGCDHCYARVIAERFRGQKAFPTGFDLTLHPERLAWPLKQKKPMKIFVNSMSDLFHKDIEDDFILQCFETMLEADWHTYQILTKRPSRLVNTTLLGKILNLMGHKQNHMYLGAWPEHIWLGTSIELQEYAWRLDKLRQVPVPIRFVSAEPLLGSLKLNLEGIAWLIAGAESGHGARTMSEEWVRNLRDQCLEAGTAFFYKQNAVKGRKIPLPELDGVVWNQYPKER